MEAIAAAQVSWLGLSGPQMRASPVEDPLTRMAVYCIVNEGTYVSDCPSRPDPRMHTVVRSYVKRHKGVCRRRGPRTGCEGGRSAWGASHSVRDSIVVKEKR